MNLLKRRKPRALVLCLMLFALVVTGCATVPPQPITGLAPTQSPTEAPQETPSPDTQDSTPEAPGGDDPSPAPASATGKTVGDAIAPTQVEILYSGMPSMMGFADSLQSTIYENTMDALPAVVSLLWPSANVSFYRYSADISKDDMRLSKDQLLSFVGNPSFYLDDPMTQQPARRKRPNLPVETAAENMNEPMPSFYDVAGKPKPNARTGASGTTVAVNTADTADTSLTLIVTDLHELRMDDGALLTALNERCLQLGRTVGVAAISSEFAGYIPGIGANDTTFVWGAPPTGTLDYLLDYTEYQVGISVDPEKREMASRPFYVLCIGDQGAVDNYLAQLSERLTREFTGNGTFKLRTAVFGSGYVPADYALGTSMRYIAGQGVTAIPEQGAQGGVNLIELKASQQARFVQWEVDYKVHPSDPRGTGITAGDFTFVAEAVREDGTAVPLPNLNWTIKATTEDTITLSMQLDLPAGVVPQGSYTLEISGSLTAPANLPGSDWLQTFGYDADGAQLYDMEQNVAAFDGSRTLFLSRLIDTLGKANIGRLGVAPLGTVRITLTVYA